MPEGSAGRMELPRNVGLKIEELRARQRARREVLLGGAVEEDAGGRCVCEELDEQSLDVSLDAVRDTATS